MKLRELSELKEIKGKRVFVRADFDVPLKEIGGGYVVADDRRLKSNLVTLEYLVGGQARVVAAGQVDRPGGRVDLAKSTKAIAHYYRRYFPQLEWVGSCVGAAVESRLGDLKEGQILVLENLRFYEGEEKNDPAFAQKLASLADYYVNENFSNCHRDHASMTTLATLVPAFGGFNLIKEIDVLSKVLERPARPLMVLIGGAKVETKLPVIKNLLNRADRIFVGGLCGCRSEFLKGLGEKVTFSCGDPDLSFDTAKAWGRELLGAKTIVWNGPMGDTSHHQLVGTELIAKAVVEATQGGTTSVIGGGDTENFLRSRGLSKDVSFISTGGGAMLALLSDQELPALKPLLVLP